VMSMCPGDCIAWQ